MKEQNLVCEYCGKSDKTVEHTTDPYELEINEEEVWMNLCENCYTEKLEAI